MATMQEVISCVEHQWGRTVRYDIESRALAFKCERCDSRRPVDIHGAGRGLTLTAAPTPEPINFGYKNEE